MGTRIRVWSEFVACSLMIPMGKQTGMRQAAASQARTAVLDEGGVEEKVESAIEVR